MNLPATLIRRCCCAALLGVLMLGAAGAQTAVGVAPAAQLYTLAPGSNTTTSLTIDNPDPKLPIQVRVYPGDWTQDQTGQLMYAPAGTLPQSASKWLSLSDADLTIGPADHQTLRYTITVPPDAQAGTHWTMLFFESVNPKTGPGTLAAFRVRVAHTIYVNVAPIKVSGKITGLFAQAPQEAVLPVQLVAQYQNTGNAATAVSGRMEVRDMNGKTLLSAPVGTVVALPGSVTPVRGGFFGPLPAGTYLLLAVLSNGQDQPEVAGETQFTLTQALSAPRLLTPAPNVGGKP